MIQDYLEYIIILSHFILSLKIEQEVIYHLYSEAVRDLQPIARTGVRDIASLATFGIISESPATSIKNQKLLYESLSNKKGYILEKYGQTSLAKKVDKADTEIRKVLKQVYDCTRCI